MREVSLNIPPAPAHLAYRADIDGLRALAVMAVVLVHAGVPWLSGGFSGVDMFFVISGYLITGNILRELGGKTFSLVEFYERRARRILPAVLVMIACTTLVACVILLPEQLKNYSGSVVSAVLFTGNIYFAGKTGYFDGDAADKPLLHLWSLGVEEQFYLVFPFAMLMAVRLVHRRDLYANKFVVIGLLTVLAVSLLATQLALAGVLGNATDAFYQMPYRAWEFMVGSLLALTALPPLQRIMREVMAAAGLLLIVTGMVVLNEGMEFPGIAALLPCLGTAFVIYAGQHGPSLTARVLSVRPVVFVGLISYSLYLWHWPLLVMPKLWHMWPLPPMARAVLVALAVVLAAVSWKFVETPVRKRHVLPSRKLLFSVLGISMLLLVGLNLAIKASHGWPQRLPEAVRILDSARTSANPRLHECFKMNDKLDNRAITPATACSYGAVDVTPTLALWGDSHADAIVGPLGDAAARKGMALKFFAVSGCPPLPGWKVSHAEHTRGCNAFNDAVMQVLEQAPTIDTVIMVARWGGYVVPGGDANAEAFRLKMQAHVDRLQAMGKRVVLAYPVPEPGTHVPNMLANLSLRGRDPASFTYPVTAYTARMGPVLDALDRLEGQQGLMVRVRPAEFMCAGGVCMTLKDGQPLYYDDHHVSQAGGELFAEALTGLF